MPKFREKGLPYRQSFFAGSGAVLCARRKCYILYHDDAPVSVTAIMDNNGTASLEFVGTIPEMRGKGFA